MGAWEHSAPDSDINVCSDDTPYLSALYEGVYSEGYRGHKMRTDFGVFDCRDEVVVEVPFEVPEGHNAVVQKWQDGIDHVWNRKLTVDDGLSDRPLSFQPDFQEHQSDPTYSNPLTTPQSELLLPGQSRRGINARHWPSKTGTKYLPADGTVPSQDECYQSVGSVAAHEFGHNLLIPDYYNLTRGEYVNEFQSPPTPVQENGKVGGTQLYHQGNRTMRDMSDNIDEHDVGPIKPFIEDALGLKTRILTNYPADSIETPVSMDCSIAGGPSEP